MMGPCDDLVDLHASFGETIWRLEMDIGLDGVVACDLDLDLLI